MVPRKHTACVAVLAVCLAWPLTRLPTVFAKATGSRLLKYRERAGIQLHSSAATFVRKREEMSPEDVRRVAEMTDAGRARKWDKVAAAFWQSSRSSSTLFAAAMMAAFRCGQYAEGVAVYERLRASQIEKTGPVFTAAFKLFSRLGMQDEVMETWTELEGTDILDDHASAQILYSSMVDAVAQAGNITGAAELIDSMRSENLDVNFAVWGSAINACKNARSPAAAKAAKFFLQEMVRAGVPPMITTFTQAMAAHAQSPLGSIQNLTDEMESLGIARDPIFVEQHALSVLGHVFKRFGKDDIPPLVARASSARRQVAAAILADAKADGMRLTSVANLIDRELKLLRA
eukprot:gb/GFBE01014821.1/.p1 GENE.gb/GFBE01014821.1/~~gb/GFBE01014821.1/.p1  ORF type:complete len:346 (+),score=52.19 gb/GFBE01014821.1/:1-1038(+)